MSIYLGSQYCTNKKDVTSSQRQHVLRFSVCDICRWADKVVSPIPREKYTTQYCNFLKATNRCCPRCSCSLWELRVALRAAKEALGAWLVGWRRFRSSRRAPAPTQWPIQQRCYQLLALLRPPVNLEYGMKQGKD